MVTRNKSTAPAAALAAACYRHKAAEALTVVPKLKAAQKKKREAVTREPMRCR